MSIKTKVLGLAGRGAFFATNHAPELLMVGGTVAMVGAVIAACAATIKFQEEIEKHNEKLEKLDIVEQRQQDGTATEEMMAMDVKVYRKHAWFHLFVKAIKIYGLTAALVMLSLGCFGGALKIISGRFAALSAAYAMILRDKTHLEDCVRRDYGEETLRRYQNEKVSDIVEVDENGEVVDSPDVKPEDNCFGSFTKIFGPDNPNWEPDMEANRIFLKKKEKWAGIKYVAEKDLFWNDTLDMLGFEKTQIGQIFGNHYYDDPAEAKAHNSSNTISFGPMIPNSDGTIPLIFNVDPEPLVSRSSLPKQ